VSPPIWLDESGRRQPTRRCGKCGKKEPVRRLRYQHLRLLGRKPAGTLQIVNWCGHPQEFVPWPKQGGCWRLVPIWKGPAPEKLDHSGVEELTDSAVLDGLAEPVGMEYISSGGLEGG